jgi:hypothetical protein
MEKNKFRINQIFFQNNFFNKNYRGQFYLIATMGIIAIIIGIMIISNSSKTTINSKTIEDLAQELKIESDYVLDYGILNNLNIIELLENFTFTFANRSKEIKFYFIFGKEDNLKAYKYSNGLRETIKYQIEEGEIKIVVYEIEYSFDLKTGENFYFIILNNEKSEKYVTKN